MNSMQGIAFIHLNISHFILQYLSFEDSIIWNGISFNNEVGIIHHINTVYSILA